MRNAVPPNIALASLAVPKQQFVSFYPAEMHASLSEVSWQPYTGRRNWFGKDKCAGMYNDGGGLAIMRGETAQSLLDFR